MPTQSLPKIGLSVRTGILISVTFMLIQVVGITINNADLRALSGTDSVLRFFQVGFGNFLTFGLVQLFFLLSLFLFNHKEEFLIKQLFAFLLTEILGFWMGSLGWMPIAPYIIHSIVPVTVIYFCIENLIQHKIKEERILLLILFGFINGLDIGVTINELSVQSKFLYSSLSVFLLGVFLAQTLIVMALYTFLVKLMPDSAMSKKFIYSLLNVSVIMICTFLAYKSMTL